jgi:hypothetical protein
MSATEYMTYADKVFKLINNVWYYEQGAPVRNSVLIRNLWVEYHNQFKST